MQRTHRFIWEALLPVEMRFVRVAMWIIVYEKLVTIVLFASYIDIRICRAILGLSRPTSMLCSLLLVYYYREICYRVFQGWKIAIEMPFRWMGFL